MAKHRHFFNMYLTTTISVALVLFLLGLECILLLSARTLVSRIKQNVTMTVVLNESADSTRMHRLQTTLDVMPYTQSYTFISRQQALAEHIRTLGEDPTEFLGYNPLRDSYELHLTENYVQADSMAIISAQLQQLPYVEKVVYQKDILAYMNSNLGDASWLLLGLALALLIIAQALIVNTIRLQIYSKRFLIKTMTLVGATAATVKAPFVKKNIVMGLVASLIALAGLAAMLYYVHFKMGVMLFPLTWMNIVLIAGSIIVVGVMIVVIASIFACGRYIRMNSDQLYEI